MRSIKTSAMHYIYFLYGLLILSQCHALNLSVPIEGIINCDANISGTIASSNDIKYYLFDDNYTLNKNDAYSVLINLCPSPIASQFDTIIYLYDNELNVIDSNDNSKECDDERQSQLQFESATFSTKYIIGIGGSNSEFGTYHMSVDCDIEETIPQSTTFVTTNISTSFGASHPPNTTTANMVIRSNVSCGSYIEGDTNETHRRHAYSFQTQDSKQVLLSTCPPGFDSSFDTDLYIYDKDLNQIAYNDWTEDINGCTRYLSQIKKQLSSGTYIFVITGYEYAFGHYYLSITCSTVHPTTNPTLSPTIEPTKPTISPITHSPTSPTIPPTPAPSNATSWTINNLTCDGVTISDYSQSTVVGIPVGVCNTVAGSMLVCQHGSVQTMLWDNKNCIGEPAKNDNLDYCDQQECMSSMNMHQIL